MKEIVIAIIFVAFAFAMAVMVIAGTKDSKKNKF